jgi:hypothetical protein
MNHPIRWIGNTALGFNGGRRRWLIAIVVCLLAVGGVVYYQYAQREAQRQVAAGLAEARARAIAKAQALAKAKAARAAQPDTLIATGRVTASTQAAELFAPHSWYVAPPPPPPPAEEAPAAPTAPPLPYAYVGSYTPTGERATYFLARGDRVIDAHVGDKLDGVLLFEKIEGGQLVFNYLPLNIRQTLPAGVVQ